MGFGLACHYKTEKPRCSARMREPPARTRTVNKNQIVAVSSIDFSVIVE
ncbi:MAG: hypothetical protein RIR52_2006 [Acidobacteriota bacterium]|jgi:hypothetical protein